MRLFYMTAARVQNLTRNDPIFEHLMKKRASRRFAASTIVGGMLYTIHVTIA